MHFPYCDIKCPFCNLNAWESKKFDEALYVRALESELKALSALMHELRAGEVETVFMGGGTPSLFSQSAVARVMNAVASRCAVAEGAEVSLEAHPLSCDVLRLKGYTGAGVNRLSIGAQSFDSEKLKRLGRGHGVETCSEAVKNARAAGFENLSVDIIAGAPGETARAFREDIKKAGETGANHISVYGLEIEKGTRFHALARSGELKLPSAGETADMTDAAASELRARGMERYEISSFALPNGACRHNINYWRSGNYIGIGAGAHSHLTTAGAPFGLRWANTRNPAEYMEKAARGELAPMREMDAETGFSDCVMMGLRLTEGMNLRDAEKKFGVRTDRDSLRKLERGGFVLERGQNLKITVKGLAVANSIIAEITGKAVAGHPAGNLI